MAFRTYAPPHWGGLDLNSNSSGCACLGSGVVPPPGVVEKEVAVLVVDDEVPGAVEEEAGFFFCFFCCVVLIPHHKSSFSKNFPVQKEQDEAAINPYCSS